MEVSCSVGGDRPGSVGKPMSPRPNRPCRDGPRAELLLSHLYAEDAMFVPQFPMSADYQHIMALRLCFTQWAYKIFHLRFFPFNKRKDSQSKIKNKGGEKEQCREW